MNELPDSVLYILIGLIICVGILIYKVGVEVGKSIEDVYGRDGSKDDHYSSSPAELWWVDGSDYDETLGEILSNENLYPGKVTWVNKPERR